MGMFGPKAGSWWISSKKDPRWNTSGRSSGLSFFAGTPPEITAAIKAKSKKLGKPPKDLEVGAMKD